MQKKLAIFIKKRNRKKYFFMGIFLAAGAPIGWYVLEKVLNFSDRTSLYLYLTISTMLAFGVFGYVIGKLQDKLEELLDRDPLTNLYHQTSFFRLSEKFLSLVRRKGGVLSVVMFDLDNFKNVNDENDHLAGSRVLKDTAKILEGMSRGYDVVARYGGDEFIVTLPAADTDESLLFCERLREKVQNHSFRYKDKEVRVTISLGFSTFRPGAQFTMRQLVEMADSALYRAKANGRNRTEQCHTLDDQ